jgi:uncharacterized Zn-binding protein involved in type VI secretion
MAESVIIDEAARITDPIEHSHALGGLVTGLLVGAVVGALVVGGLFVEAFTLGAATPGLVAIGVAVAGEVGLYGGIGQLAGSLWPREAEGIASGAPTVFIGGKKAARAVVDTVECHAGEHIAEGSETVFMAGFAAARKNDKTSCGGKISEGFPRVLVGSGRKAYIDVGSEIPAVLGWGVFFLGFASGASEVAIAGKAAGWLAAGRAALPTIGEKLGGYVTGKGAEWAGDKIGGAIFGERSYGQEATAKVFGFAGEKLGGFGGGRAGERAAGGEEGASAHASTEHTAEPAAAPRIAPLSATADE